MESVWAKLRTSNADESTIVQLQDNCAQGAIQLFSQTSDAGEIQHLIRIPQSVSERTLTAIVSSRLGRKLSKKDSFFRVLRIACSQLHPKRQVLISSPGSATHTFVTRAAQLFGLDLIEIQITADDDFNKWLSTCNEHPSCIHVSPPLGNDSDRPLRDAIPILFADQVLAIHLRAGGNVFSLLQQRLSDSPKRTFLAMGGKDLVTPEVADPLSQAGAIGWYLLESAATSPLGDASPKPSATQRIITLSELTNLDRYLTHCTRGTSGAWPDQDEADFLDELIFGATSRDRSALAALMRILGQSRILATSEAIRGKTPVVSFTAERLDKIQKLRCFRSHRGRWDFEPYGIAIDRELLKVRGARPVIYGDESVWEILPAEDKPFFQRIGQEENSVDWSVEKEYRLLADLNLSDIPPDRAVVFVPSQEEAQHVATASPWPVVVL